MHALMSSNHKSSKGPAPARSPAHTRPDSLQSLPPIFDPLELIPTPKRSVYCFSKGQQFLKLNVGGTSFKLSIHTVLNRGEVGLLYKFAIACHERRLKICDGYFDDSEEYFFERSPLFFEAIRIYYLSGCRIMPPVFAREAFIAELSFWGLSRLFYPTTIARRKLVLARKLSWAEKFKCVRFGTWRKTVWFVCEDMNSSKAAACFALISILAVLLSNLGLVLSSMSQFQQHSFEVVDDGNETVIRVKTEPHQALQYVEYGCITFFTIEYLTKLIAAPDRYQVILTPMNIVDLVAILPFYFELVLESFGLDSDRMQDVRGALLVTRILRVLRVFRLFKLGRYSSGLRMFTKVLRRTLFQLGMVTGVVSIGIMVFSTMIYYVENDVTGTKFESIPAAFWWCIVTMTTVGYGDMVPDTVGGKLVGACAIACGTLVLSMPITIFVNSFINVQEESAATSG